MIRRLRPVVGTIAVLVLAAACTTTDGSGSTSRSADPSSVPSAVAPPSGSAGSGTGSAPSQAPARFTDCRSAFRLDALPFPAGRAQQLQFGCARIDVPLDYSKPRGRTIALQLVRVHDRRNTSADPRSLVVNPGGPGASGVELAVSLSAQLSDGVLRRLDVVGFDPRGVNLSSPVRCLTDAQKDAQNAASPDVLTTAGFRQAKSLAAQTASACTRKYGSAIAQYNTVNTARDLDRIRASLGDRRLTYLGFSYGTELGAQYAHLFPSRVGAFVLDGAVNPVTGDIASFANQIQGFENTFDQFESQCSAPACRGLGDARLLVEGLAARTPIPSGTTADPRELTSSLLFTGVLSALYSQSLWPQLAEALTAARQGRAEGLLALADRYNQRYAGKYTNISDANTTIGCNDQRRGPSDATIRATARQWVARYPLFGRWAAAGLFSCQQWQPDRTVPALPTARAAATTVLVVGNRNDPATPYAGAVQLTRTMGKARLLTWDGEGHTSFLQGSACIDRYVDAYLERATLPREGAECQ
ncbi:alpha/beta hydrolase [Jatrophihabitans fulvus]